MSFPGEFFLMTFFVQNVLANSRGDGKMNRKSVMNVMQLASERSSGNFGRTICKWRESENNENYIYIYIYIYIYKIIYIYIYIYYKKMFKKSLATTKSLSGYEIRNRICLM